MELGRIILKHFLKCLFQVSGPGVRNSLLDTALIKTPRFKKVDGALEDNNILKDIHRQNFKLIVPGDLVGTATGLPEFWFP